MTYYCLPAPQGQIGKKYTAQNPGVMREFFVLKDFGPESHEGTLASFGVIRLPSVGMMMTSFARVMMGRHFVCETVIRNCGATFQVVCTDLGDSFIKTELKHGDVLIIKPGCWFAFKSIHGVNAFICYTNPGELEYDKD